MLGRIKRIANQDRKFGALPFYNYLRTQDGLGNEEAWLVSDREREQFRKRAIRVLGPGLNHFTSPGHVEIVDCQWPGRPASKASYYMLSVKDDDDAEVWALTSNDLEKVRTRTDRNPEDIETHKPGMLEDLLD
jgi:hypothetical protein